MSIVRTVIRFILILIFLAALIYVSVNLFKLIPKGINQLASATVSLGQLNTSTSTKPIESTEKTPIDVPVTSTGLNSTTASENTTGGDIVIKNTQSNTSNTSDRQVSYTNTYEKPRTTTTRSSYYSTYTYETTNYAGKNLGVIIDHIGIIDKNTGSFLKTNTYRSNDIIVVKFRIFNDQITNAGPLTLRVDMPAYLSEDKVKIINNINIPGQSSYDVEARFDGIDMNISPIVKIHLDSNDVVKEINENDNISHVNLGTIINNGNNTTINYNNDNNNNGSQVNLNVVSIEVGKMSGTTFIPTSSLNALEKMAVRAKIRNNGGNNYSNNFNTRLLVNDGSGSREFNTYSETSLSADAERIITYEVDSVVRGKTLTISFSVDSNNNVNEYDENDNTLSTSAVVY